MKTFDLQTILITKEEKDFIIKSINSYKKRPKYDFNDRDYFINKLITIDQLLDEFYRDFIKYTGDCRGRKKITKTDLINYLIYSIKSMVRKRIRGINFIYFPETIKIELYQNNIKDLVC